MNDQLELYAGVHKGQRARFSDIAMKAGTLDYDDKDSLEKFYSELSGFKEHMYLHASLEERFIHPLLSQRVPGGARKLEVDHVAMRQQIDDLAAQFDKIRSGSIDSTLKGELVLEFYRGWNRFVSFYFRHIDYEEENAQPMLWKICTGKELADTFKAILANQTREELEYNLRMMFPALNLYERVDLLNAGKLSMPPQAFQGFLKIIENVLGSDDWKALKLKTGIN